MGVGLTIGRLPDNAVVIDNPAVSGHHARVFSESGAVILEDLRQHQRHVRQRPAR